MAGWALFFLAVYLATAFGVRTIAHRVKTGSTGFVGITDPPGSAGWWGGMLFAVALLTGFAAPIFGLAGLLGPVGALDQEIVQAAGGGMYFGGLVSTALAQAAMGKSWRIGVDPSERLALVTDGPFAYVRNPVFAAMLPATGGTALLFPSPLALVAFVALFVAIELQIRYVEEPYLLSTHGRTYRSYASRTGRLFPLVGRLTERG